MNNPVDRWEILRQRTRGASQKAVDLGRSLFASNSGACVAQRAYLRAPAPSFVHSWRTDATSTPNAVRMQAVFSGGLSFFHSTRCFTEAPEPHLAKVLDIIMLTVTGGRERTRVEYQTLFEAGGFRLDRVIPTARPHFGDRRRTSVMPHVKPGGVSQLT